jgi:hypothetical protein
MAWRVARSLEVLRDQLNTLAPNRSKASDGSIGDENHQNRTSDHNPWYPPPNGGIVTARDFTHDPAGGLDCNWLANTLVAHRDARIKYIIWARRIWNPTAGWRAYSGANPHTNHLHLSVVASPECDNSAAWAGIGPPETDVELGDKVRFWDGFEITVGQVLADTWQLTNNMSDRPTRPDKPADIVPWVTQLFAELAAIRTELATVKAEVSALKARDTADADEAALAAELDARGLGGVSAAQLAEIFASVRVVAPERPPA